MGKYKFSRIVIIISMVMFLLMPVIVHATAWHYGADNRAESNHTTIFSYDGYIQFRPNSWYNGNAPARGYIRYYGGSDGDTGRLYTAWGKSKYDGNIYSRQKWYTDTLTWNAPKVQFNFGFDWVPTNSNIWPV